MLFGGSWRVLDNQIIGTLAVVHVQLSIPYHASSWNTRRYSGLSYSSIFTKLVSSDKVCGKVNLHFVLGCLLHQTTHNFRTFLIKQGVTNLSKYGNVSFDGCVYKLWQIIIQNFFPAEITLISANDKLKVTVKLLGWQMKAMEISVQGK